MSSYVFRTHPFPGDCTAHASAPARERRVMYALAIALMVFAVLGAGWLGARPAAAADEGLQCAAFEDLAPGARYTFENRFASTLPFEARGFQFADGTRTNTGAIEVGAAQMAGGTGQELAFANAGLRLLLPPMSGVTGLTLRFGEYGGNVNLLINGDFRNVENLSALDGATVGGALLLVAGGFGNDAGELRITAAAINAFEIGGQEFFVDELCASKGTHSGQPGTLRVEKRVETSATPVRPGDVFTYTVRIEHVGGTSPAVTTMRDELPAGLHLAGPIEVVQDAPSVSPLVAFYGERAVKWMGSLAPGGKIAIIFPVRLERCFGQPQAIVNTAWVQQTDATRIQARVETPAECPAAPPVVVSKRIVVERDGSPVEVDAASIVPGTIVQFRFQLVNGSATPVVVPLRDRLPEGLVTVDEGSLGPVLDKVFRLAAGESKTFDFRARLVKDMAIREELVNIGRYIVCPMQSQDGTICQWPETGEVAVMQTNPVTLTVEGLDLGDAPDATNHPGAPMSAYTGIPATFPTVVDAAGGEQGPAHANSLPFHLGEGVSREANADLGPDADRVNNIVPRLDQANLDGFDDGLRVAALGFEHCRSSELPVQLFVGPDAATMLEQGVGYLNVWVDGQRNGDWRDVAECTAEAGAAPTFAFEHIVVDYPVDASALGAGLHTLLIPTTHPVLWPAEKVNQPAWLRITLSERPSNKPFEAAGVRYGDGRGDGEAGFALGETEDYLWRARLDPANGPDLVIRKQGVARPNQDPQGERNGAPSMGYDGTRWVIEYGNRGLDNATGVRIVDNLAEAGNLADLVIRSEPVLSYTLDGAQVTFAVGALAPGQHGRIAIQLGVAAPDAAGVFTNTAAISGDEDVDPSNNEATARIEFALRPPLIVEPGSGTTCDGAIEVLGRALPGAQVELVLDGALLATVTTDETGRWSYAATVADGNHELYAIARLGAFASDPSRTLLFTVDSTLVWSPLSLRVTNELGWSHRPVDENGRTDQNGWSIRLRPGGVYTISVKLCCSSADAGVQLIINETDTVELSDPEGDGVYAGSFMAGAETHTSAAFRIVAQCGSTNVEGSGTALIDPDGVVYDVITAQPLAAAGVACMQAQGGASGSSTGAAFSLWPAEDFGQLNPQATRADGYFSFYTPAGAYRLEAARSGYQPYRSTDIQVIDEAVHYDVPLTPEYDTLPAVVIQVTEYGFEPAHATIRPGEVVEWVNMAVDGHSAASWKDAGAATVGAANFDSGLLLSGESYRFRFDDAGVYTYVDSLNPANEAVVTVAGEAGGANTVYLPFVDR